MAKIKTSKVNSEENVSVKKIIRKKMQCLNDFNICSKNDAGSKMGGGFNDLS